MRERRHQLQAAFGALALLISALFSPVVLATQIESDTCAMACCVEAGHCCCKPSKLTVAGQHHDGDTTLSQAEIATSCPEGCTTAHISSNLFQRDSIRPATHPFALIFSVTTHAPPMTYHLISVDLACIIPRAPPVKITIA